MSKSLFKEEWSVRRKISGFVDLMGGAEWAPVTLPHDAMIDLPRVSTGGSDLSQCLSPSGHHLSAVECDVLLQQDQRRIRV